MQDKVVRGYAMRGAGVEVLAYANDVAILCTGRSVLKQRAVEKLSLSEKFENNNLKNLICEQL